MKKSTLASFFPGIVGYKPQSDNLEGSKMFFDNYCGNYKVISLVPERFVENKNFRKKGILSTEEKVLAYFFSLYRVWQTWSDNL